MSHIVVEGEWPSSIDQAALRQVSLGELYVVRSYVYRVMDNLLEVTESPTPTAVEEEVIRGLTKSELAMVYYFLTDLINPLQAVETHHQAAIILKALYADGITHFELDQEWRGHREHSPLGALSFEQFIASEYSYKLPLRS